MQGTGTIRSHEPEDPNPGLFLESQTTEVREAHYVGPGVSGAYRLAPDLRCRLSCRTVNGTQTE